MRQLILDLPHGVDFSAQAWLMTAGVRDAAQALALDDSAANGKVGCVCVYGPEGVGKSHLLAMVQAAYPGVLAVDDVESLDPAAQELLFHEFNKRAGVGLVVASRVPVAQLPLLPDLKSRLLLGTQVEMRLPDEKELCELLARWAEVRQLHLPTAVVDYLLLRAERNPKALAKLMDRLDALSLEQKRAITVPLAREVISG